MVIDGGPFTKFSDFEEIQHNRSYTEVAERPDLYGALAGWIEPVKAAAKKLLAKEECQEGNVPFVLSHGDFELHNVVIGTDPAQTLTIVDWEWGGSFPIEYEWAQSYQFDEDQVHRSYHSSWLFVFANLA